jgi:hypothetical protein
MLDRETNTLGFLAIAGSIMMTTMYSDGDFDAWDVLPGVFLLSIIGIYWRRIEVTVWTSLAFGILAGGAMLMIIGHWVETMIGPKTAPGEHDLILTLVWAAISFVAFAMRYVIGARPARARGEDDERD